MVTKEQLSKTLKEAGAAHHEYEQTILKGEYDQKWADWYAAFAIGRVGNFTKPSILTTLLLEAQEKHKDREDISWQDFYATFILENK